MTIFDVGDKITIAVDFRDNASALTDPTTVTIIIERPDGTQTIAATAAAHSSTGHYSFDYAITAEGLFFIRWEGTGTLQAAVEDNFSVRPRRV